ncbi:NAD(P)-binding protein [Coprinellus micaceus]|uniref:NAD(P)-binding protein n=1 Tax=Coprinellus micaceus TaxID=71717 RepID=A0A4Y7TCB3_COPMI|nr:NAD(P)-binding protein [Coprinellus micaceus]
MSAPTPSLDTLEGCQRFVQASSPEEIAAQLHRDRDACRHNTFPSLLAHVVSARDDKIAIALQNDPRLPLPVLRMLYSNTLSTIKNHMGSISHNPLGEETEAGSRIPEHLVPTNEDFNATLKVLRYMQLPQVRAVPSTSTPVGDVAQLIHGCLEDGVWVKKKKRRANKLCYICRYTAKHPHKLYPSLCNPCGEFNVSSSALSLPGSLDLTGKVAVVTGGRVNLGYHTALRMLRCGARVVVSSRYPYDAETRYTGEPDFAEWKGRLKVVGADFRTAKDVFALIEAVKTCLEEWGSSVLHILINNAAQTLTDSVEKEDESIRREQLLLLDSSAGVVMDTRYQARIRGGNQGYMIQSSERQLLIEGSEVATKPDEGAADVAIKSSWTQSISEIPYEDVISAHSVNTFVPFILLRELLPLMPPRPPPPSQPPAISSPTVPLGYVINVSSREGLFERSPSSSAKSGLHVHTNMSKAALNMLTETEAASAWQRKRVSINSVDPGYMSADPMFMDMLGRTGEPCPIGWEDGAGRVLWPIAKGEKGEVFWGRFFKHFREIAVGK